MAHLRDIKTMSLSELGGMQFDCACGSVHSARFANLRAESGALCELPACAKGFETGRVLLVADSNTYTVAGKRAKELLLGAGFAVDEKILLSEQHSLIPNEWALGSILAALSKETALIVAVGSGSINDLCRTVSARTCIPYIIVATAPSMDGYASTVAPLILDGKKVTLDAVAPHAILADTDILKDAPQIMLQAGFGDIIGKITALADWELSEKTKGESRCTGIVELVHAAIDRCVQAADRIPLRDSQAVEAIATALIFSGVAMGMVGNSRPASGAEHHFSHYWEVDALACGVEHALHGNSVGAATPVVAAVYHALDIPKQYGIDVPQPEEIEQILRKAGAAANPKELGIEKELFHRSVLNALYIRPRYTVMYYAQERGQLPRLADELTERYYG